MESPNPVAVPLDIVDNYQFGTRSKVIRNNTCSNVGSSTCTSSRLSSQDAGYSFFNSPIFAALSIGMNLLKPAEYDDACLRTTPISVPDRDMPGSGVNFWSYDFGKPNEWINNRGEQLGLLDHLLFSSLLNEGKSRDNLFNTRAEDEL